MHCGKDVLVNGSVNHIQYIMEDEES